MTIIPGPYERIFEPGTYFEQCHASTLLAVPDGTVLAAWFAGPYEKHPDVSIWMSRRTREGWGVPEKIVPSDGQACWNPVLSANAAGRVFLYYKVGLSPTNWHTRFIYSDDGGASWSAPTVLVKDDVGGRGPVKNKCILSSRGEMLAPASLETDSEWDAFVDISKDGVSYTASAMVPIDHQALTGKGIIQPTLWEAEDGRIHMLLRSSEGFVYRSDSQDWGRTWCEAYPISLPNNNSGIDLVKTGEALALVHNPVGVNWGIRSPIVLSLSHDGGQTWQEVFELDRNDTPRDKHDGEFSYPAIISQGDKLLISYTWKRRTIAYRELTMR